MLTLIHRLRKLGKLALSPTCLSVDEYSQLEEWVHEDGRVVVIGDAAHPLPVRKVHCATCDSLFDDGFSQEPINHVHWLLRMVLFSPRYSRIYEQKIKLAVSSGLFKTYDSLAAMPFSLKKMVSCIL
jgi:hypothetical protein